MSINPSQNLEFVLEVLNLCAYLISVAVRNNNDFAKKQVLPDPNSNSDKTFFKAGIEPEDVFFQATIQLDILKALAESEFFLNIVNAAVDHPRFKLERSEMSQEDGRQELYADLKKLIYYGKTFLTAYNDIPSWYEYIQEEFNEAGSSNGEIPSFEFRDSHVAFILDVGQAFESQAEILVLGLKGEWRKNARLRKPISIMNEHIG